MPGYRGKNLAEDPFATNLCLTLLVTVGKTTNSTEFPRTGPFG